MTEESASSSSSHFYPHGHAKIEEMLQFISRGRKPLANYHLGTMDERAYLHFLEGALTVMNGKTYVLVNLEDLATAVRIIRSFPPSQGQ